MQLYIIQYDVIHHRIHSYTAECHPIPHYGFSLRFTLSGHVTNHLSECVYFKSVVLRYEQNETY